MSNGHQITSSNGSAKVLRNLASAIFIGALWLAAFRIADLLTVFKSYSSVWFLPTGVTMAIVMVTPGWLKLIPLAANLSLALPPVRAALGVDVENDFEPIVHGIRLFAIYGGAGWFLVRVGKISLPFRSWGDVQKFVAVALVAASIATASGIGLHVLAGNMSTAEALSLADSWWMGDALGAVMVPPLLVPVLLAVLGQSQSDWTWPRRREWALQTAVIAVASLIGALGPSIGANLWYFIIPPVMIFALRGGFESAASAILLICVITPAIAMALTSAAEVGNLSALLLTSSIASLLVGAATSERQRAARDLEALVEQRTAQLARTLDLQRHLLRSLGHDLRQPVEAINLTLETLAQHPEKATSTSLVQVRTLGNIASDLLTRILIYARLDTGEVRPQFAPFATAPLIERLQALYDPQAYRRGVTVAWPEADQTLLADRELIFQVLSNLLDNAIRLSATGDRVMVQIETAGDQIAFIVSDAINDTIPVEARAGGLGLRIVSEVARLLDATIINEKNRKGIVLTHLERGN